MAQFLCIGLCDPFTNLPFKCCAIYFDSKVLGFYSLTYTPYIYIQDPPNTF